jgi:hypothetical protein
MRFLSKLRTLGSQLLYYIFPFYEYYSKSKKIWVRIKAIDKGNYDNNLQYVERLEGFKEEDILKFFDRTLEIKKSLEEKSKSILLSMTVAITLIIGLITIFLNHDKFFYGTKFTFITYFIFIIGFVSVLYMIIGAIMSLQLLSGKIQEYQLFPVDLFSNETEKIKRIAINTEQNANMNIIRSNIVYTAYKFIIYSLVCLCIFSLVLLSNINLIANNQNKDDDYNKLKDEVGRFSSQIKYIESTSTNDAALTLKKINDLEGKIDSLTSEIKKIEISKKIK